MPDVNAAGSVPLRESAEQVDFRPPTLEDGGAMWRMARDSQTLDLNTSYAYLLWARDFASSSVVATVDGEYAGFISGYVRPDEPTTLMIWQVATNEAFRGRGIARRMLDAIVDRHQGALRTMETTITEDNAASIALFTAFAKGRRASVERTPLFTTALFPDGHDTEHLFRIGPL